MARKGYRKLLPEQVSELAHLYTEQRLTLSALGARFGIDPSTVREYLFGLGVHLRTMRESKQAWISGLDRGTLEALYARPMTVEQIAAKYGVRPPTIYSLMCQMGISRRSRQQCHAGVLNHFTGKHHSPATLTKLRDDPRRHEWMRRAWENPEYVQRVLAARNTKPTFPEQLVITAIAKEGLPFAYNAATAELRVGRRIPDFRPTDGVPLVVEVFGELFHDPAKNPDLPPQRTFLGTIAHYRAFDYDCAILWSKDVLLATRHGAIGQAIAAAAALSRTVGG